ncbi:hypothetical protein PLICRDRAFT_49140 [Plicaturopsis crispa FD-325 SS-3]|nr:hypothetical protein PLICRDRAFT_49140 [Plicaturopsis crispa FD-325 SS-3]
MGLGPDIFGYIAGAVGIIGALYAALYSQLPKNKIAELVEVFEETETLFYRSAEEGLLTSQDYVYNLEKALFDWRLRVEYLRATALCSTSFAEQCVLVIQGLTRSITAAYAKITQIRASVLTKSQYERERLLSVGQLQHSQARYGRTPPTVSERVHCGVTYDPSNHPPSDPETKWAPRPRLVVELDRRDLKLQARIRRGLRRSHSCPAPDSEDLFIAESVPEKSTFLKRNTHTRADSGASSVETLVSEESLSAPSIAEENPYRCSSPLPFPDCTPELLKDTLLGGQSLPVYGPQMRSSYMPRVVPHPAL